MARTTANGCTPDEELAAARMVANVIRIVDAQDPPAPPQASGQRGSDFDRHLERATKERLLKAALLELSLLHLNTLAPPAPKTLNGAVEPVAVPDILAPHLAMMLGAGGHMPKAVILELIEELIEDGQLPARLTIPLAE